MNLEEYNQKRDELAGLLQEVLRSLEEIEQQYGYLEMSSLHSTIGEITDIRRKVYEDIYKIVLVANFQGGKSTSFNAISGGAYLSPMGNGALKCSASPISAKSVVDARDVGATVFMRSLSDLNAVLGEEVHWDDAQELELRRAAWQEKWELAKEKKGLFSDDAERDTFVISGFMLHFVEHPMVQERLQKASFDISLEEARPFVTFPKQYTRRLAREGFASFRPEEAMFVFVRRLELRVQSEEMAKIGASFVDAPGLGAAAFDTNVTRAELLDASAVWYLLGARAPGEAESRSIQECVQLCHGRVFFSANILGNQTSLTHWKEEVLPEIAQRVSDAAQEPVELRPYHALLALLYIQGTYYMNHGHWLDESIRVVLVEQCKMKDIADADTMSTEDCWRAVAEDTVANLHRGAARSLKIEAGDDYLSAKGLEILRRESNWDGTVEAIREFVVNSKSESVLITDTAQKALKLLEALQALLVCRETESQKTLEESQTAYNAAEQQLNEFVEQSEASIAQGLPESKDKVLAEDFFEYVFRQAVDTIAEEAAPKIVEKAGFFRTLGSTVWTGVRKGWRYLSFWFSDDVVPDCTPIESSLAVECRTILQDAIRNAIGARGSRWFMDLKSGRNQVFQDQILKSAAMVSENIQRRWQILCQQGELSPELAQLRLEIPKFCVDGEKILEDILGDVLLIDVKEFLEAVLATIGIGGLALLDPTGLTALILAIIYMFRKLTKSNAKEEKVRESICSKLQEALANQRDDLVQNKLRSKLSIFREAVIASLRKPLVDIREQFRQTKEQVMRDLLRDTLTRQKIAAVCKEIRESYLDGEQGLVQRINTYIEETRPLCVAPASTDGKKQGTC